MAEQIASRFCSGTLHSPAIFAPEFFAVKASFPLPPSVHFSRAPSTRPGLRIVAAVRREFVSQAQRDAEMEEEARKVDLAPHKLLQKGENGTMQGVIKDVMPVGYFITLPTGREGYLPALDLGFTGGIVILERLFKVGQEVTVRVVRKGSGGREILSIKKPEFAPNTDPRQILQQRWGKTQGR